MAFRSGYVVLLGKPNVGKSTLVNALVGHKVSIVSNKPQTTRRRVMGIAQGADYQIAFVDTPGIHEPHTRLGRALVDQARAAMSDMDLILFVADGSKSPDDLDKSIAKLISSMGNRRPPVLVCLNKMDKMSPDQVVPNVEAYCKLVNTEAYMLTTATRGDNLPKLQAMILEQLPEGEAIFPEDEFTDQSSRFLAAELIREHVLTHTRQEVPHATAVRVDDWVEEDDGVLHISATVLVEKQGQKAILIGKQGQFIKELGTQARLAIQEMLERPVFLELHVSVRENWRMDMAMIQELEYGH